MHPLEKKVQERISDSFLLGHGDTAVVAVSGGPDSMALLHLLAGLSATFEISLVAAYVDHGLRPQETGREEQLVRQQADLLGVSYRTEKIAVKEYANLHKLSIEHAARILRYEMLEKIALENRASKIAVAHTADDQAEEVLLRLLRGTGRKGLSGMGASFAGRVIRPLLEISKDALLSYLDERRIPFLVDSSNLSPVYLRNKVRLQLIPYLIEHYNPNLRETLRQTAHILAGEEEILEKLAADALERSVSENQGSDRKELSVSLIRDLFAQEHRAIQRRILETICWRMESPPSFRIIESLRDLAMHGKNGDRLHLADGLRVNREGKRLIFAYPEGKVAKRGDLTEVLSFEVVVDGPGSYPIPEIGKKVIVSILERVPPDEDLLAGTTDYLDGNTMSFPLALRSLKPADRFHPLGAPGRKKVNDFLSDRKIPVKLRWQVAVLADEQGVAALLGLRIDEARKVTSRTNQTVAFRLEPL